MKQITATVEHGQITLPASARLPEGTTVTITWDEDAQSPLEKEEWTEEETRLEIMTTLQQLRTS